MYFCMVIYYIVGIMTLVKIILIFYFQEITEMCNLTMTGISPGKYLMKTILINVQFSF